MEQPPKRLDSVTQSCPEKPPVTTDIEEGTAQQYDQSGPPIDEALESKLRWKMDLRILPTVTIIYYRANIGNAKIAGLEADLKMQGYDFNISLSIFYISYILFEIPLNLLCKRIGPGWFIPACCLGFGICTTCTAFVHDFSTLCGLRFLLGVFEAAMLPANVYYLSRWYRRSELTFRLSFVIISASLAGAFGGLLASAILSLRSFGSLHSWRMIFAIEATEGTVTCAVGVISFFTLTDRVETATWLSPEQKDLANARIMSERPGTTEIIDKFGTKRMLRGILNPVVLPTAVISFFNFITHSVRDQQLLTVPPNVLGTIMCMLFCYISWRIDKRGIFLIICAPFSMVGYSMFLATSNPHVRYAATFLPVCGIFAMGAFPNAHISANVISDTSRSSAVAFNVMLGNIGGLVSTWAFLPFDGPEYRIGNGLNLAAQTTIFLISICVTILRLVPIPKKTANKHAIWFIATGNHKLRDKPIKLSSDFNLRFTAEYMKPLAKAI
ncbi:putative MFS transporter [Fusarium beomiforme]|uniref:MFS transporter n=1 Tax=Fusarium beomiforme TaxID=44412 RepID=A0A9P5AWJ1_9HYPO|nr:putative MFS transporter [Fusarium beomiforme]